MSRFLLALLVGLILGLLAAWWWLGGSPRALAQSSERLFAWVEVTSTEELPVSSGGTPWIVGCTLHLRNMGADTVALSVPPQRFLVVLGDGTTVTGQLAAAAGERIAAQQTVSIALPKVSFIARSQDAASVVIALDEGDGLRLVAAPVGDAPQPPEAKPKAEKPAEPPAK